MDFVTYGSIIAIVIIALMIIFIVRKKSGQPAKAVQNRHSGSTKKSTDSPIASLYPLEDNLTKGGQERKPFTANTESSASRSKGRSSTVPLASTLSTSHPASCSFTVNGGSKMLETGKQQSSAPIDSGVLLLLPTEGDNYLNTSNAFKSPPGNLKTFSLYSDFVNEVSDDVLHVTDSFLHGINSLIDSDYHLVYDDQWRRVMEENGRLAHMTSSYVRRYRYPHYAGHIHQMLVTSLTTLTGATELINESFVNAINGETDQAQSKLKKSERLFQKLPKDIEYCNSAMATCFVELEDDHGFAQV